MTSLEMAAGLFGRDREIHLLKEILEQLQRGIGGAVLFEGEPGIGKSSLVMRALEMGRELGLSQSVAQCREADRDVPFRPFMEAFEIKRYSEHGDRAAIAEILFTTHERDRTSADEVSWRTYLIVDHFVEIIERMSQQRPMLLAIDDLQWLDRGSLILADRLLRLVSLLPIALVCASRDWGLGSDIEPVLAAIRGGAGHLVKLAALDPESTAALAESILDSPVDDALRSRLKVAGGNPFLITEFLHTIKEDQSRTLPIDPPDTSAGFASPSFRSLVLSRVAPLNPEAIAILKRASVLGSTFELRHLSALMGTDTNGLFLALSDAFSAGVLESRGHLVSFRHDLLREALYLELPEAVRKGLHRDVAEVLAEEGASPSIIANHMLAGANAGDRVAIEWLRRAGTELLDQSPASAVHFLEAAERLAGGDDRGVTADLARAFAWTGRPVEAERIVRDLMPTVDKALRSELEVTLFHSLKVQGKLRESTLLLNSLAAGASGSERTRRLADAAMGWFEVGARERAMAAAGAVLESESLEAGAVVTAHTVVAGIHFYDGRIREALGEMEAAMEVAREADRPEVWRLAPHYYWAGCLLEVDQIDDARRAMEEGLRLAERTGSPWITPLLLENMAYLEFITGNVEGAVATSRKALASAEELATRLLLPSAYMVLGRAQLRQGDVEGARSCVDRAATEAQELDSRSAEELVHLWLRALVLEADRALPEGVGVVRECLEAIHAANGAIPSHVTEMGPDLVRICLTTSHHEVAAGVADVYETFSERMGTEAAAAASLSCRGMIERRPELLADAVSALRGSPRRLFLADTLEAAASLMEKARAIPVLEEAREVFESSGATRDAARVSAILRGHGVRRGSKEGRQRPRTGWDSLTEAEGRVMELLVSEGLTYRAVADRLFVSRRTVETHVSRIFDKLGVRSRAELAAEAARRGAQSGDNGQS